MPVSTPLVPGLVLSLFSLVGFGVGQDPGVPAASGPWQVFQRESGGSWQVQWHAPTGTPRSLYGEGLALDDWRENSLDEARRHASAVLRRWPELLGLGTSEFRESIGARMGQTWTFTFAQWFRGLPVIGGHVDVRIHMRGRLCFLGSTAWPIPADFDTTPKVDEATAAASAWLSLHIVPGQAGSNRANPNRLTIWGDPAAGGPVACSLAWEVPIHALDADGNGKLGRAYVDARTGAFLQFVNDKHECGFAGCAATGHGSHANLPPATYTVMAWTHTALSPVSTPTNVPLAGLEVVVPGNGTLITDQNGQFTASLSAPTQVTVNLNGVHTGLVVGSNALTRTMTLQPGVAATFQLGSAGATERQLAHSTAYFWTHRTNEWARSILGNSPQLALADNVAVTVNIAQTCNAFYSGNSINFYASGSGCNNTAGASVVAHEWGHGLDDLYGGISQTNGLSEGWGDICSIYSLDDPTIGHDFFSGGGGLRSGNNTRQYPFGSGSHDQGESWMGFAWKFRQNLRATLGNSQAISISNNLVLGSIVASANNQQDAVLAVFLADDDDGNLANGTPHHAELAAACQVHSLPYPPIQAGYLVHTALPHSVEQATPRRIEVDAIPVSGSFSQVRVHWNNGVPAQRNLIPSGTPNRWHGLLPGQLAPQSVLYHFEALHSNNTWLRLPASGEYLYGTTAERRIYFEDFETGGVGWTHGAISGLDDWEIGLPGGRSGVGWADPGSAASGARCAGTDLGLSGDGAYSPWSEAWLRSPVIDCTGLTGIRLRFKRWLTCDGPADRVELWVGGLLIWINPLAPTLESTWSTFEIWAPIANNNPNVTIEFRVRSTGGVEYGGWNIDDVELFSGDYAVPLPAALSLSPEQAQQGTPVTIDVRTQGMQPFLLVIGDVAGPTVVPGIPTLQAGGNLISLFRFTDAMGQFSLPFAAPVPALVGTYWYSHVLALDASGAVVASNAFVNLFTR